MKNIFHIIINENKYINCYNNIYLIQIFRLGFDEFILKYNVKDEEMIKNIVEDAINRSDMMDLWRIF